MTHGTSHFDEACLLDNLYTQHRLSCDIRKHLRVSEGVSGCGVDVDVADGVL